MRLVRVFVVVMLAAAVLGGCVDGSEAWALRERAASLRDERAREESLWRLRMEAEPQGPERAAMESRAAWAAAGARAADRAVRRVDSLLAEANNPTDPLSRAVGVVVPFLPEPARTPVALGAALVVTALRARRLKVGLASIARGLERAMRDDEQFAAGFRRHAATFRSVQTPLARRIVDEATKDRFMVRLPI